MARFRAMNVTAAMKQILSPNEKKKQKCKKK